MNNRDLIRALSQHVNGATVKAITPHGTYQFEIVAVEKGSFGAPVLRLAEVVE